MTRPRLLLAFCRVNRASALAYIALWDGLEVVEFAAQVFGNPSSSVKTIPWGY